MLTLILASVLVSSGHYLPGADGVRLWTSSQGKGSPIVVIHGGPGMDQGSLNGDLAPLARNHRLIFYDQRGGGRSTLPEDPKQLTIGHHVRDLEALRRALGLKRMTLLAHSFGPAIAALYAIRYPQHVERLIFIAPIPPRKGRFFEEYGARLGARLTEAQQKRAEALQKEFDTSADVTAVCREYWAIMTPPRLAKTLDASVVKSDLCTAPPEAIRYGMTRTNPVTFGSLGEWDWTARLRQVQAPALIIAGEEDAIPIDMVAEWATSLPNAQFVSVPHAAHFTHAERPEVVFPAIEAFLRSTR